MEKTADATHPGLDAAAGEPEDDVDTLTLSEGSDKLVGMSLHKARGPDGDGGAVAHEHEAAISHSSHQACPTHSVAYVQKGEKDNKRPMAQQAPEP
eukprot:scaffold4663_cov104-Isochrysis_galbana.AAC.13